MMHQSFHNFLNWQKILIYNQAINSNFLHKVKKQEHWDV